MEWLILSIKLKKLHHFALKDWFTLVSTACTLTNVDARSQVVTHRSNKKYIGAIFRVVYNFLYSLVVAIIFISSTTLSLGKAQHNP